MINFDYKNKVAVVTGGTSGIGLATVRIPVSYTHLTLPTTPYV